MAPKHQHEWRVLRVQIPWRPEDFDPDRLAPERARDTEGKPHSDKEHAAKVAKPRPEVVLQCHTCKDTEAVEIPGNVYQALVDDLKAGVLNDDPTNPNGSDLSTTNLRDLIPELADEIPAEALARTGSARIRRHPDGTIERSGLSGKPAEATEIVVPTDGEPVE